jgi:hypothetical protein
MFLLFVKGRFHELNDEFRDGERALLLFEEVDEAFPSVLDGRAVAMRGQFLLDFLGAALLLGDVEFEELDVVRGGGAAFALGAVVVEAESGLDGAVDQVLRLECASPVEEVPVVEVVVGHVRGGGVEECVVVEQAEQVEEQVKGVLAAVAQQFRHLLVEELAHGLTGSTHRYIGVHCPVLRSLDGLHHGL